MVSLDISPKAEKKFFFFFIPIASCFSGLFLIFQVVIIEAREEFGWKPDNL